MAEPTLRQLRSWHRRLSTCHSRAVEIANEACATLGEDDSAAILISDPIIELHAALSQIEGLIANRRKPAKSPQGNPHED